MLDTGFWGFDDIVSLGYYPYTLLSSKHLFQANKCIHDQEKEPQQRKIDGSSMFIAPPPRSNCADDPGSVLSLSPGGRPGAATAAGTGARAPIRSGRCVVR